MSTKESNLVNVSTLQLTDRLRIVQQNLSRNVSYQDLINDLNTRIVDISQRNYVRTVSNNYVIDFDNDQVILVDASSNDVTVTLPLVTDAFNAPSIISTTYAIKRIDNTPANTVLVFPQLAASIDGDINVSLLPLAYVRVVTDGNNWWIVS